MEQTILAIMYFQFIIDDISLASQQQKNTKTTGVTLSSLEVVKAAIEYFVKVTIALQMAVASTKGA